MKSVRILSVDGGGLRGVIPALLLAELEKRSGRPCAGLFDLMAGTSAGAIVTLGLAVPGPDGAPRHSATSLAGYYAGAAQAIFPLHLRRRNRGLDGGEGELYPPDGFNAFLQKGFGDARLSGALAFRRGIQWCIGRDAADNLVQSKLGRRENTVFDSTQRCHGREIGW